MISAQSQALRYVNGGGFVLGRSGKFTGFFLLTCNEEECLVYYDTPRAGVVLYYLLPIPDNNAWRKQELTVYNYVPKSQRVQSTAVGMGVWGEVALGVGFGMALSSGCSFDIAEICIEGIPAT